MKRTLHDVASLAARMGVGGIFFANGWEKLEAGLNATATQYAELGAPLPSVWAAATMLIELVGGTLLVAGLAVPFVGLLLFAEAVAVFVITTGHAGMPLTGGDIKIIVALGAASVLLSVGGAGRVSVDHMVVIKRREAEAADEFAADREADAVIAALRDPADASRTAIAPGSASEQEGGGTAPKAAGAETAATAGGRGQEASTPKGPVTFPTAGEDSASSAARRPSGGTAGGRSSGRASGTPPKAAGEDPATTADTVPNPVPDAARDSAGRDGAAAKTRARRTKRGRDENAESRSEAASGPEPGDTLVAGPRPHTP
ncbi:DoxX family membrane protein [Microtetraspora niveoalba]|uniref:DoxX family membrane protein n=1 Tax=Microtetraspora niveoalba TaxID=46175 RepID=UPI000836FC16|nr:DoxX family protein [Microtetraspora niveoalba]